MVLVYIFLSTAVIGGMTATSPAGVLDSSSCGPAGEMNSSSSSSMTVGIDIIPSSLYTSNAFVHFYDSNIISRICHATSSVVPIIGRNAFVHRCNIHTSAEDQSLGLEDRGTAGKLPRTTRKNRRSQRTHRWALYTNVRDAEGADIWPAPVARHSGSRGTAQLVESTVISVASALRHAGLSQCSRMPAWSLRLATSVARQRRSGAPFLGRRRSGRGGHCSGSSSILRGRTRPCAFRKGGANVGERSSGGCGSGGNGTYYGNGDRRWSLPRCVGEGAEGAPVSTAVAVATVTGSGVFPAASARGAAGVPGAPVS